MEQGIVYIATFPNFKHYIGKTTQSMQRRWYDHCRDAKRKRPTLIAAAINFYYLTKKR